MSKQVKQQAHREYKDALQKKKTNIIILCVVLAVAVITLVVMLFSHQSLRAENTSLTDQLQQSQESWQAIADEKTAVESKLAEASDQLREAQTALEESEGKIVTLDEQVRGLTGQVDELSVSLAAAIATNSDLTAYIATTTDLVAGQEAFIATTTDLVAEQAACITSTAELLTAAQAQIDAAAGNIRGARENQRSTLVMYKGIQEASLADIETKLTGNLQADERARLEASRDELKAEIQQLDNDIAALDELLVR